MKKHIYEFEENYTATVVEINGLNLLEGLDNLRGTNILGNQVLVGKDTVVGERGIFFPSECQLSEEFTSANNLFKKAEKNADPAAKPGFIEDNRRIKALKFRGHNSSGFFLSLSEVRGLKGLDSLRVGDEFQTLDGQEVCRKYYVQTKNSGHNLPKKEQKDKDHVDSKMFREHSKTSHFAKSVRSLNLNDVISVSIKLHGTSLRVSNTIVRKPYTWIEKLLRKFNVRIDNTYYKYVVGSRVPVKSIDFNPLDGRKHYYGDEDIYTLAGKVFDGKLHKAETVYAEIIGYYPEGSKPLQKGYTYGVPVNKHEVYVYRISRTNVDGVEQDLPWNLMTERCRELGVKHVPEVYFGTVKGFLSQNNVEFDERNWQDKLQTVIATNYLEKPSIFSNQDWQGVEEGVVIAKHRLGAFDYMKAKSELFKQHESKMADQGVGDVENDESNAL